MTTTQTTLAGDLGVAFFTVADQDEAKRYYTESLGFEVRADITFAGGEARWLEVAPVGSTGRLALNPAMGEGATPGGGGAGIEVEDVEALHAELTARGVDASPMMADDPDAPKLFMLRDPDGNHLAFTQREG